MCHQYKEMLEEHLMPLPQPLVRALAASTHILNRIQGDVFLPFTLLICPLHRGESSLRSRGTTQKAAQNRAHFRRTDQPTI